MSEIHRRQLRQPGQVVYFIYTSCKFILIDDNARPQMARVVQNYLERKSIDGMDWSARSPDLNPTEHMWDELQDRISARQLQPSIIQEL
jgi:hypothetical protein